MKRFASLSLLGALLLAGCGQEIKLEHRVVLYPDKKMKEEWSISRTPTGDTLEQGPHKKYFWNGSSSQSVVWKMGMRDGSAQAWYESGAIKWQKNYENGKKQGTQRLTYKGGQPWIVANYDHDVLEGKVQVWDKADATVPKEATFTKGNCTGGDCALLELPPIPADIAADKKAEANRDRESVTDFLD